MAIEKTINIKVNTGDSDKELDKLESGFKSVDKAAEKTNKSVDDVAGNGGAIAILDQLTGGLATRFRDAFEASKLFNFQLKAMRGALIATGIGALVVALGLVVAYWDDIVEFIEGANKKLQKQIDLGKERIDDLEFELEILEIQSKTLEAQGKSTVAVDKKLKETLITQLAQAETQLELLKSQQEIEDSKIFELSIWNKIQIAAGGQLGTVKLISEEEAKRRKELKEGIEDRTKGLEGIKLKLAEIGKKERDETQKTKDAKTESDDFFANEAAKRKKQDEDDAQDALDKRISFQEKQDEALRDLNAKTREDKLRLQQERDQEDLDNLIGTEEEKEEARMSLAILHFEQRQALKAEQDKEDEDKDKAKNEKLKEFRVLNALQILDEQEENAIAELELLGATEEEKQRIREFFNTKRQALEESALDKTRAGIESVKQLTADVFSITDSLGKQDEKSKEKRAKAAFAVQKSMNLGLASIDATKAILTSLSQAPIAVGPIPSPAGIASLAFAAATGAATIAKIATAKFKGGVSGGSKVAAPSGGGGSNAPSFNLVQGTGSNQIAEGIESQQDPIRAVVVSGDVTTSQSVDRNIVSESSI